MKLFRFNKIQHRVFFYVFASLIALVTVILVAQLTFFDDWYLSQKQADFKDAVNEFVQTLETEDLSERELYHLTELFYEENGAIIYATGMMDIWEELYTENMGALDLYEATSGLYIIEGAEGDSYYLEIPMDEHGQPLLDVLYQAGDQIEVSGFADGDFLYPIVLDTEAIDWQRGLEDEDLLGFEDGDWTAYQGVVTVIGTPEEVDDEDLYYGAEDYHVDESGLITYYVEQPFSDVQTIVYEKATMMGDTPVSVYSELSLQNVQEMTRFLGPFFIAFYLLAFVVVFFIARVLSVQITRPILAINKKALALSELDFTEPIVYESDDELGQLAESVNHMSVSLEQAMSDLEKANRQLLADMELEREREGRQKEFVANVSHELKTPIGIAKGYVEAVLDGIRKERQEDYLKITLKELDRMNQIVLNMLELMKLENLEKPVVLKRTRLQPIMSELEAYFQVLLEQRGMGLQTDPTIDQGQVDVTTFKSLMLNLLSNAIHYGVAGTTIKVTGEQQDDGIKISVINEVADPDEIDLDRIWHKFYTMDKSHNREKSGTGLGLSIVRSILDQYGATYALGVEDGRFIFEFNLKK